MSEKPTPPRTLLQRFLRERRIPSARFEAELRDRMGAAARSRRQVERWRLAKVDIRRKDMVRILWAVRRAANDPDIQLGDLFDLDPNNPDNWID